MLRNDTMQLLGALQCHHAVEGVRCFVAKSCCAVTPRCAETPHCAMCRLKNRQSRLFQQLHGLKARQRTLLTGTPLQNNLQELWMLLHFLDAAKFESLEAFQQDYSDLSHGDQVTYLLSKPHKRCHTKPVNSFTRNLTCYVQQQKWSCPLSCSFHSPTCNQTPLFDIPSGSLMLDFP